MIDINHASRRTFLGAAVGGMATLGLSPLTRHAFGDDHSNTPADLILHNAAVSTMDPAKPNATAFATVGDRFLSVGSDEEVLAVKGPDTRVIDAKGKRVIPGLNDSHAHFVRQGLNYHMEVRWDGVDSLERALEMLREQAARTPKGQWIRVIGGFSMYQFKERRMPTLDEINAVSQDHPVFILYLYAYALLNNKAMEYLDYDKPTRPTYPGGRLAFDRHGKPTGAVFAYPSGLILYKSISNGPRLNKADQINSSLSFQREMHSLGITSVSDCGGGGMVFPDAYGVFDELNRDGLLKIRTSLNTFPQVKGQEEASYRRWVKDHSPKAGTDDMLYLTGAGENICWAAYDYEIFNDARPDIDHNAEDVQQPIMDVLAANGWPTRQHMTYNETIDRLLGTYEAAHTKHAGGIGKGPRMLVDHAETITDRNLERIAELGGGMAIQNRIIYQAEDFARRYGPDALKDAPPVRRMMSMGLPMCAGTDATRVSSHNPWLSLAWLCTGKSLGGMQMYGDDNLLDREEALRLWTLGSAWSTGHEGVKGAIAPGQFADFIALDRDYFQVTDAELSTLRSELTGVAGEVVYAAGNLKEHDVEPLPPVSPEWSPVKFYGGYQHVG
ncbi:MAG: amidohydrolase [Planctomycetota bacterium]